MIFFRRLALRLLLAQICSLLLLAGAASAFTLPVFPPSPPQPFDFWYDATDDITYGEIGSPMLWASWLPESIAYGARDGRAFTVGSGGLVSVFTRSSFDFVGGGVAPQFFYLQGSLNGVVLTRQTLPNNGSFAASFPDLYDEIRFGWDFPYGIDAALDARPGWYDPGRDVDDYLKPGQIGCYYYTCSFSGWVYAEVRDPLNGNRPAGGQPPAAAVPLPAAGLVLPLALLALTRVARRRRTA